VAVDLMRVDLVAVDLMRVDLVPVDLMRVDLVAVDLVGVDLMEDPVLCIGGVLMNSTCKVVYSVCMHRCDVCAKIACSMQEFLTLRLHGNIKPTYL